jgi:hypothetical protein
MSRRHPCSRCSPCTPHIDRCWRHRQGFRLGPRNRCLTCISHSDCPSKEVSATDIHCQGYSFRQRQESVDQGRHRVHRRHSHCSPRFRHSRCSPRFRRSRCSPRFRCHQFRCSRRSPHYRCSLRFHHSRCSPRFRHSRCSPRFRRSRCSPRFRCHQFRCSRRSPHYRCSLRFHHSRQPGTGHPQH